MLTNGTHIGILFDPRSGSHVFQHFLCEALNSSNYLELFNAGVTIKLMENEVATTGGLPPIIGDQNRIDILNLVDDIAQGKYIYCTKQSERVTAYNMYF